MPRPSWIAKQSFRCVLADGQSLKVEVKVGAPERVQEKSGKRKFFRCRLSLEPLAMNRSVAGENDFQALCLALDYIRTVFKVHLAGLLPVPWTPT